jgi:hypothetical protein
VKVAKLTSAEAYQQELEQQQWLEEEHHTCSICQCDYTSDEGGIEGDIGILPASFCPTCLSGVIDMVEQLTAE